MGISTNTVIHFTKKLSTLKSILTQTFKLNYCREKITATNGKSDFLVPCVSFCDIPFSQILNHVKDYGCYGIGLSKNWATKKGLNPVLYVDNKSKLGTNFYKNLYAKVLKEGTSISNFTPENKGLFDIMRYMKNYQGDLDRGGRIRKNFRYYNEREWRYVLPLESSHQMFVNCRDSTEAQLKVIKAKVNEQLNEYLSFGPDDINYIIIKSENQREGMIRTIRQIKDAHDEKIVAKVASRVISIEQIKSDF